MMGRLYSFSHNKLKPFRLSSEKVNQSEKILRKAKYTSIWNISKYEDYCLKYEYLTWKEEN